MSDKIEIQGKTVEHAVSEALLQLGARKDEVKVTVLEEPKSGFLGILGNRQAKVLVEKKTGRRRGGQRDYRDTDNDAITHELGSGSGSGSRRSGRRGGRSRSGKSQDEQNRGEQGRRDESRQGRGRGDRTDRSDRSERSDRGGRKERDDRTDRTERADSPNRERDERKRGDDQQGGEKSGRSSRRGRRGGRGRGGRGRGDRTERQDEQQVRSDGGRQEQEKETRSDRSDRSERPERSERSGRKDGQGRDDKPTERRSRSRRSRRDRNDRNDPREQPRDEIAVKLDIEDAPMEAAEMDNIVSDEDTPKRRSSRRCRRGGRGRRSGRSEGEANGNVRDDQPAAEVAKETPADREDSGSRESGSSGRRSRDGGEGREERSDRSDRSDRSERRDRDSQESRDSRDNRDDRNDRDEKRRAPAASAEAPESYEPDVVLASGLQASKYAQAVREVPEAELDETISNMTTGMLVRAGFPCRCEVKEGEYRQVRVITGDDSAGMLIGRHGSTVDAVEHLVERMMGMAAGDRVRMNLDINNYRRRREETLTDRVAEAVDRVRETERDYHMEPMCARERRLIHLEAEKADGIRTYTLMRSGDKHVVIALDRDGDAGGEAPAEESGEANAPLEESRAVSDAVETAPVEAAPEEMAEPAEPKDKDLFSAEDDESEPEPVAIETPVVEEEVPVEAPAEEPVEDPIDAAVDILVEEKIEESTGEAIGDEVEESGGEEAAPEAAADTDVEPKEEEPDPEDENRPQI